MSNIYDNQIKEMQRLINYGKKETPNSNNQSIVEYCAKGADGKTYGIIREGHNFYIKVAPKKNTEILAEDYDYIGGFNNKKENEYSTYTLASKQFDLKLKALNEAYNAKTYSSQYKPTESSEWQINETKEMRRELDRYRQLVENVNNILEGKEIVGMKQESAPFTEKAVASEDKDVTYAKNQYYNSGSPFDGGGKLDNAQTSEKNSSDKNPKMSGDNGDAYKEKPTYPDVKGGKSVADQKPKGGNAKSKVNEGRTIKINEEQVLAWSKSKDFMDKSHGTEIGSSSPFNDEVEGCANGTYCEADTEPIREDVAVHITDDQNSPEPGVSEPGHNGDPFDKKVNEAEINPDDVAGFDDDEEDYDDLDGLTVKDNLDDIDNREDDVPQIASDEELDNLDFDNWNDVNGDNDEVGGMDDPGNFDPESDYAAGEEVEDEDDGPLDPNEDLIDNQPADEESGIEPGSFYRVLSPNMGDKESKKALANRFGAKQGDFKPFDMKGKRYFEFNPKSPKQNQPEPAVRNQEPVEEPDIDTSIDFDQDAYWGEGKKRRGERIYEVKLDDFGKHPAYRKEVMTLPPNKEIDRYGKDWNDDSAKGDEPFGKQIGSSAPYTEKVVDMLTDAIFNRLKKKV